MILKRKIPFVVCGMSGGVDSSVAALLLKKQGYEVLGIFMKNWDIRNETGFCVADVEREDAYFACKKIGIKFSEVNFVKEYWNDVFSELVKDYQSGYTPNPDIICNKKIKFKVFHNYCLNRLGADHMATGHYARITGDKINGFRLLKGVDFKKDQSFFLSQISQESLEKTLFPIGNLNKVQVKGIAVESGLEKISKKKESTGICFIGKRKFQDFMNDYVDPVEGNFIHLETGQILGKHKGKHLWTIGQRSRVHSGSNPKLFISKIEENSQNIYVVPGTLHPALFSDSMDVDPPYWIHSVPDQLLKEGILECDYRFQHANELVKCTLYKLADNKFRVCLKKPLRALSPGQFSVFYLGDECLGSTRIKKSGPSLYDLNKQVICNEKNV